MPEFLSYFEQSDREQKGMPPRVIQLYRSNYYENDCFIRASVLFKRMTQGFSISILRSTNSGGGAIILRIEDIRGILGA